MSTPPKPPPLDPTLWAYCLAEDVSPWPWGQLLAPWTPPLPREGEIIMVSLFADVFVRDQAGEIWWLNAHEARVDKVAPSIEAFQGFIEANYIPMLKTPLVDGLIAMGMTPAPGRMFGLKTPIKEGGRWAPDNVGTASVEDTFAYLGSLFQKPDASPAAPQTTETPKKKGWFN